MDAVDIRRNGFKVRAEFNEPPRLPNWKYFIPAVIAFLIAIILFINIVQGAETYENYSDTQIVEAIGKAENSVKFPYGIKSIPTYGNKELARKYCLNSVRNGRARWIKAGRPDDLITFIGLRYCPPKAHKLNTNWTRNVKHFLTRSR